MVQALTSTFKKTARYRAVFCYTARMQKTFAEKVRAVVAQIPKGQTMTYGEVAKRAGNPSAARAVGAIMRTNYDPDIPCHRVIKSDGTLGGYNRGIQRKRQLLEEESVLQ